MAQVAVKRENLINLKNFARSALNNTIGVGEVARKFFPEHQDELVSALTELVNTKGVDSVSLSDRSLYILTRMADEIVLTHEVGLNELVKVDDDVANLIHGALDDFLSSASPALARLSNKN